MNSITHEDRVVFAILEIANARHGLEQAAVPDASARFGNESQAERIVREHGFDLTRVKALRGLARSRDVDLEVVLRAALRGDLRDVVLMPAKAL
jgi:hypothetical protein